MAYIYKITNLINGKLYIGQTYRSIECRWKEHCRDIEKYNRPISNAIKKYGSENFSIEIIETIDDDSIVDDRECYWIEYYRSFKNGYNATIGGKGQKYLDYDLIIETYKQLESARAVARHFNIGIQTVLNILHGQNISTNKINADRRISVNQFSLSGEYIQTFASIADAAKSLGDKKTTHISSACKGKLKTAYGFKWQYAT